MAETGSARIGQPVARWRAATSCGSTPLRPPARMTPRSHARPAGTGIHALRPRDGSRIGARIGKGTGHAEERLAERQIELHGSDAGVRPGVTRQLAPQCSLGVVGDTGVA